MLHWIFFKICVSIFIFQNKLFMISLSCCIEFSYVLPPLGHHNYQFGHHNYQDNYQVWQSLGVITVPLAPQWVAFQVAKGVRLHPLRAWFVVGLSPLFVQNTHILYLGIPNVQPKEIIKIYIIIYMEVGETLNINPDWIFRLLAFCFCKSNHGKS